jgi:hypothetical protein
MATENMKDISLTLSVLNPDKSIFFIDLQRLNKLDILTTFFVLNRDISISGIASQSLNM